MSNEENREDLGTVKEVIGETVRVEVIRGSGCKSCSLHGFCFTESTPAVFHLESKLELQAGDLVRLDIAPKHRVLSSFLVFMMPIVFLFAGYAIASLFLSELVSAIIGFAALGLSFLPMRVVDKRLGKALSVHIAEKVNEGEK